MKGGRLLGCAAPISVFPGNRKYGCSGVYDTAETCDAAPSPVRDTSYVWAVHKGCNTDEGKGTYGYAYDDGVGLKQCSPMTKYEWILCPDGTEDRINWKVSQGADDDSTRRFRVTNRCNHFIWIEQSGAPGTELPGEDKILALFPHGSHDYSIPNRGLASTRFLPKTGCDSYGNNCDVQSMPPCPPEGCVYPVDTKFEASWGCLFAKNTPQDAEVCALTPQGNPNTYQDWWDGSAVDGWTLPFSVLVDDDGTGLTPGSSTSSATCSDVICANLDAERLCPTDEYLLPSDAWDEYLVSAP